MGADSGALYDRDVEVDALGKLLDGATAGTGGAVVIEGAVGAGKTALLHEAQRMAATLGVGVSAARATDLASEFSFGVVRQLFEPLLAGEDTEERASLLAGADTPAVVMLDEVVAQNRSGDFAVLHSLFWLTANVSEKQPHLLIVDDLHYADVGSLKFLAYLVPHLDELACSVVAAVTPLGSGQRRDLIDYITTAENTRVLHLSPLSADSAAPLLRKRFARSGLEEAVTENLVRASHAATGGNPLLLTELADALCAEGVDLGKDYTARINELGPRAVARRVGLWMKTLSPWCLAVTQSVAVLGDGAEMTEVSELAGLTLEQSIQAAEELQSAAILALSDSGGPHSTLTFGHSLVRAVVYETMPAIERGRAHHRAATILQRNGADTERVASHLLRTIPANDADTVLVLCHAADMALRRGAPDSAVGYLSRCLDEPPHGEKRVEVLFELGRTLRLNDTSAAAGYLRKALRLATSGPRQAAIALVLGRCLLLLGQSREAMEVWTTALENIPASNTELIHHLQACVLSIPLYEPGREDMRQDILRRVASLRDKTPATTPGGRAVNCVIAAHDAVIGDPRAVPRALHALEGGQLIHDADADIALPFGWMVLISADRPEVLQHLDAAVAQAYREGSVSALTGALTYRALAWLRAGNLTEAEADARNAVQAVEAVGTGLRRLILGPILADTLIERDDLSGAERALDWVGVPDHAPDQGLMYYYLCSKARLLRQRGHMEQALEAASAAGQSFLAAGGQNPAVVPWHTETAYCLHRLGRSDEALTVAHEELRLARNWSAPQAWGHALRVAGILEPDPAESLSLMEQALHRLQNSVARLEYAKALTDYAAALRRRGKRAEARQHLDQALPIAETSDAVALQHQIVQEYKMIKARPRRYSSSGWEATTPSERRVSARAATGMTNREIAKELFITPKTVELHLSNVYRKLGISTRRNLREKIPSEGLRDWE